MSTDRRGFVGMRGRCSSGKIAYDTRQEAKQRARQFRSVVHGKKQRAYRCPLCDLFHLSSADGDSRTAIRAGRA